MTAVDLDAITLDRGGHDSREDGVCAMELVAWLADEPHSDHPACTSPVLGAFLRNWNDALDDEGRQRLKPFLPRVIGTALDGQDEARAWLATDWLVRVCAPAWLELAGVKESPAALRALPPITAGTVGAAQPTIRVAREKGDSARVAAGDAARAAARAAAGAAARDAAWVAAGAAAWDAAGDAARAAAWVAAGAAARVAARAALKPTVVELQASALVLLERMIDPAGAVA